MSGDKKGKSHCFGGLSLGLLHGNGFIGADYVSVGFGEF